MHISMNTWWPGVTSRTYTVYTIRVLFWSFEVHTGEKIASTKERTHMRIEYSPIIKRTSKVRRTDERNISKLQGTNMARKVGLCYLAHGQSIRAMHIRKVFSVRSICANTII